jgi:hypothetical protein
MSTRLDDIERNLAGLTSRGASAFLSLNDIFALVAVARAAITITGLRGYEDDEPYAIALDAALAPLLDEKEG